MRERKEVIWSPSPEEAPAPHGEKHRAIAVSTWRFRTALGERPRTPVCRVSAVLPYIPVLAQWGDPQDLRTELCLQVSLPAGDKTTHAPARWRDTGDGKVSSLRIHEGRGAQSHRQVALPESDDVSTGTKRDKRQTRKLRSFVPAEANRGFIFSLECCKN